MFKDEYTKQMSEIAPSPALNEETLALMQEAQQHPAPAPKPKKQLTWVLPFSLSATAAVLALVLGLNAHFNRPKFQNDIVGEDTLLAGTDDLNSSASMQADSAPANTDENAADAENAGAPNADANEDAPADEGQTPSSEDENAAEKPESGDTNEAEKPADDKAVTDPDTAEKPQSDSSANDPSAEKPQSGASSGNAASPPQSGTNKGDSAVSKPNNDAPPAEEPDASNNATSAPNGSTNTDESNEPKPGGNTTGNAGTPEKEEGKGEASDVAKPIDPKAPVEINDKQTETYLSLRDYVDALAAKKTIGYGKNYLGDCSLAIVPSWLPKNARFRQIYAYANGGYAYSYLISDANAVYYLNISVGATPPKTMRDLNLRTRGIKTEEIEIFKSANQRVYYFGNYDKVTVSVTSLAGKKPTPAEVDALLNPFELARYTEQNGLLEATYE